MRIVGAKDVSERRNKVKLRHDKRRNGNEHFCLNFEEAIDFNLGILRRRRYVFILMRIWPLDVGPATARIVCKLCNDLCR